MKDFDLRYELGVVHMPQEIADQTGLPNPYTYDDEMASLQILDADAGFMRASVSAEAAMRREDHAEWTRHDSESRRLYLKRTVLSAMLEQVEVERSMETFDSGYEFFFGDGNEHDEPIR